ncbi:flagellar hook assembly protein FlgD [Geothrix sp. PMB-07]|uniref:flagellar hook assembly protein FlgD n=1 Tax=Geothrix sp. PMB-07 TaxID=3068640 RepID=UPI00274095E3|nr:flagellar hook capping FlgD N-terminal domain-containing protein [Geothrix sp. PMB-07]WLT32458.1 flagellar hook capping FlgD N-terminal domain-containing protein [Geothrix sp. PMB-07]
METGMISTATSAASATSTTKTTAKNTIDKDGFLQLLVAQLKNQDPTSSGQDPNAMVQQLTSFSSLEQAQQTNTLLQGLQTQTSGLFQAQTASMVGKNVKVNGSAFNLKSGAASMNLGLGAGADVTITLKDAKGNVVAKLPQGHMNRGMNTVNWDGRDINGTPLPDGTYAATVVATGDDGKPVDVQTSLTMKVDAVTFKDGGIYLASGNSIFSLADVLEISA